MIFLQRFSNPRSGLGLARGGFTSVQARPARGATMAVAVTVHHLRVLANRMHFENTLLVGDAVDVHRSVATLSSDVFVERIPGDALDVVIVLCDLMHAFAVVHRKDPCAVIGASGDDILASRAPRKIVHLHGRASESCARLPVLLLVLQVLRSEITAIRSGVWTRRRGPDDNHPIISGGRDKFAIGAPAHNVHSGRVPGEGRDIFHPRWPRWHSLCPRALPY